MAEADDLLAEGFADFLSFTSCPTLTAGLVTVRCIAPAITSQRELMSAGYWDGITCKVELLRTDAIKLGIVDRLPLIYKDARGLTKRVRVLGPMDDDSVDACVGVTLREDTSA